MAVLAAYAVDSAGVDSGAELAQYLADRVFAGADAQTVHPDPRDVAGFAAYLTRYRAGLEVERAAISAL